MVNQSVWIGISVGVFFAGLIIGFGVFTGSMYAGNMPIQNTQTMMGSQSQNFDMIRTWMDDPKHVDEMSIMMNENHDFAMQMMTTIIEDPAIRLQMLGHMTENQEAMEQMRNLMGSDMGGQNMMNSGMMMNNMTGGMMDSEMMGSGMMDKDMMMQMMQDPETREKMIQIMTKHVTDMQNLLSSELTDEEFNTQMSELMQTHMNEMKTLMPNQAMHQSMK